MDVASHIEEMDDTEVRAALKTLLQNYTTPAFGALPKREIDLLFFRVLRNSGLIQPSSPVYSVMTELRLSRSKVRTLMFDLEIREAQEQGLNLDDQVRSILINDIYFKDGNYFILEVENPVVQSHLREICRRAKVVTDASFNPSLVRLPVTGLVGVLDELLPENQKTAIKSALVSAGSLPDTGFRGVVRGALTALATKFAGEAVGAAAGAAMSGAGEAVGEFLKPLFEDHESGIEDVWSGVWT